MQDRGWDRLFVLGLLAAAILIAAIFPDYGIGRDEPGHLDYGARALAWYASFGSNDSVVELAAARRYGALHAGLLALLAQLLPLDGYETAHLTGGLLGLLGAAGCHLLAAEFGSRRAGVLAALLLLATPVWWQHSFNNPTDIPFAVASLWSLLFLARLGRELPEPRWPSALGYGATLGAAMSLNLAAAGAAFGTLAAVALAWAGRGAGGDATWGANWREHRQNGTRILVRLLAALAVALAVLLLTWPWAVLDAPGQPAADRVALPRWSLPAGIALKLPEPFLLALLGAAGLATAALVRGRARLDAVALGAAILMPAALCLAGGLPDAPTLLLVPPMAAAAGIALDRAASSLTLPMQKLAAVALLIYGALHGWTMARLHPYEGLYVNQLAGGTRAAAARFAMDPNGSAMSEAARELTQQLIAREGPNVLARRFRVELCGAPAPALYYLPARWRGRSDGAADFVIIHAQAGCRPPEGGREFLRVERAGQLLAQVHDLRAVPARALPSMAQSGRSDPQR